MKQQPTRTLLVTAVSALPHTGAIVIATGIEPRRQERARRKCIERLLAELASRGFPLWFSNGATQNSTPATAP